MDLLSISEQECAIVTQDSPSSDDLDDSTVTFGQQNSEKLNFEKIHYKSFFEQESRSEEEKSYNIPGRTANETPHIAEHPGEKIIAENRACGSKKKKKKQLLGENLMKSIMAKYKLIKSLGRMTFLVQLIRTMNYKSQI